MLTHRKRGGRGGEKSQARAFGLPSWFVLALAGVLLWGAAPVAAVDLPVPTSCQIDVACAANKMVNGECPDDQPGQKDPVRRTSRSSVWTTGVSFRIKTAREVFARLLVTCVPPPPTARRFTNCTASGTGTSQRSVAPTRATPVRSTTPTRMALRTSPFA